MIKFCHSDNQSVGSLLFVAVHSPNVCNIIIAMLIFPLFSYTLFQPRCTRVENCMGISKTDESFCTFFNAVIFGTSQNFDLFDDLTRQFCKSTGMIFAVFRNRLAQPFTHCRAHSFLFLSRQLFERNGFVVVNHNIAKRLILCCFSCH